MLRPATLALLFVLQSPGQAPRPPEIPVLAEYPPQDFSLAFAVDRGNIQTNAAARMQQAPADVETLKALWKADDVTRALQVLRHIVHDHPARMADAADALRDSAFRLRGDDEGARRNKETMRQILADARAKLDTLPREEAARAERAFMNFDGELTGRSNDWRARLEQFVDTYRGTRTALLSEVDVISAGSVSREMFDALDRFIAEHPGTEAAAKALYHKGFQWHTINTLGRLEPRGADPTARFLRVLDIVRELQSGRYPASEWTVRAPSLIIGFFIPKKVKIAPGNVDLLIRHFTKTAREQFELSENFAPDQDGIGYLVTSEIGDLYERKGERIAGVERTLDELERTVPDRAGVRLLRGLFYLRAVRETKGDERAARLDEARAALRSASAGGSELNNRRALATLAALEFEEGRYAAARSLFAEYADKYSASPWTWVARIRIGECLEAEGQPAAAVTAYLNAADRHRDMPMARVLGAEYAARTTEVAGDLGTALALHRRALAGWDNVFGTTYSSYARRAAAAVDPFVPRQDSSAVGKDLLRSRIEQLQRTLSLPGGAAVERARALLARQRYEEAIDELDRMLATSRTSPVSDEARALANHARVEAALAIADVRRPDADRRAALAMLEGVHPKPLDAGVTVARMMRSVLLLVDGKQTEAESVLAAALEQWQREQPTRKPANALEDDVAQIRRAVFLPRGGGIYGADDRWNAFRWGESKAPYLLVNSEIRVKLHDGDVSRVSIAEPLPDAGKLLFFDTTAIDLLKRMPYSLGGTKRREPGYIMETPNQPVGDSTTILALWQRFFPARPGHWGGWELEAYPVISEIHFTNPERTKAAAKVTIGYSGCTVELEREEGRWVARRLTNQWIT